MVQNNNYNYGGEMEIDLQELFFSLLNKWHLIALTGFLCALTVMAYAMFMIPEKFESKTSIYIYNQQQETITYTDLQTGTVLTKDYEVLVKGRAVLESVLRKLGLSFTYEQINSMVSVTVPSSTRIVEITVKTTDPYLSRDIADAVREISSENIAKVMGVDAVNVVETANLPEHKCSPDITRYTLIGGMFGIVFACAVIGVMHLLNDTIRTQDDVEKYLGLSILGTIPLDEQLAVEGKKRKKIQKNKKKMFQNERATPGKWRK